MKDSKSCPFQLNLARHFPISRQLKIIKMLMILRLQLRFSLVDEANTYLLSWTTTPWTLLSNLACGRSLISTMSKSQDNQAAKIILLLKHALQIISRIQKSYRSLSHIKGELRRKALCASFSLFCDLAQTKGLFRVIVEGFVH